MRAETHESNNTRKSVFSENTTDPAIWLPRASADGITPSKDDVEAVHAWTKTVFGDNASHSGFFVHLLRQDHGVFHLNRSCLDTPLKIGSKTFEKGFGTHSDSRVRIGFPEPVAKFTAVVGIDNNHDTENLKGSVRFLVLVDGKELLRTETLRGTDEAFAIALDLPENTTRLDLVVDNADDGPSHDQADWCSPVAQGRSGKIYDLTEASRFVLPTTFRPPFSFKYNGVESSKLLPTWKFDAVKKSDLESVYRWTDPESDFAVSAEVRLFSRFCAVEWMLTFTNGKSGLLEDVRVIDMNCDAAGEKASMVVHTLRGDDCTADSWLPIKYPLRAGERKTFTPHGGRSSNETFPFWNIQKTETDDETPSEGLFVALGWSGQWKADFARTTPSNLHLSAGMEHFSSVLQPGETLRMPRILLMPWKTDRLSSQVLFRRLLMFEYAPKRPDGLPQNLPVVGQCFDRYFRKRAGWEKIEGQKEYARKLAEAGCDAHWFDAAWFPVGFPRGVGNWFSDPENFPDGVGELGKYVHDLGMKFILWFEPERVGPDTQISKEHPQYAFGNEDFRLYKLNDPQAREFMTERLLGLIKEFGVDVFRIDFNIEPLPFWRKNDTPDRQGMTEVRYVEGLYEMWNRILKENPGLWIDNCASGGRRIDLETTALAIPLWRSDTCCFPGNPEWCQTQTLGIAQYLPLFSSCAWDSSPYVFRSAANPGAIVQYDFLSEHYDLDEARASIREAKVYRKFWYGDFYPLSDTPPGDRHLLAWQLNRPDLEAGVIYVFRQRNCPYTGIDLKPRGIDPDARYRVTLKNDYSPGESREMSGSKLATITVSMEKRGTAVVVEYERIL